MNILLRLQNKATVMSIISGLLLIAQLICSKLGYQFDSEWVNTIVTAVLSLLTAIGVFVDPTTPGVGDSAVSLAKTNINETAKEVITEKGL